MPLYPAFHMSQGSVAILSLTAGYVYFLIRSFGETKRLSHIHSLGFSDPILSYWSALRYVLDPPGFLRREWQKIPPDVKFVKVPSFTRWTVMPTDSGQYSEIVRAPDRLVSAGKAIDEYLQAVYTLHMDEVRTPHQVAIIMNILNRSLGELLPLVHQETVLAFEEAFPLEGDGWKSFTISRPIMNIVGRISNRVLVGLPLCRNEEYINANIDFAVEVMIMAHVLALVPAPLRSFVNRIVTPIEGRVKQIANFIQPVVDARRAEEARLGESYDKPFDFLEWTMDSAIKHGESDRQIVIRMMLTNFGSIHTTSLTFTNALLTLLAHSQYIDPLRTEIEQAIKEEGWTKAAMDKMELLESFMKESQRVDIIGAVLGNRLAIGDLTLNGVFIPKGTMLASNILDSHFSKAAWGPDSLEFDPYRCLKLQKESGKPIGITTTSPFVLTFGHGRHACPGRYFAAQEMKLMMAYTLVHYDIKLDSRTGERPKNWWIGNNCMPDPRAKILLRRRRKAEFE